MAKTYQEIVEYVEEQNQNKCKVLSAKPENRFSDLGFEVTVWNVKTDAEGDWWVVEGEELPMNLYPQSSFYFSADEVYSFHIGIMKRMLNSSKDYVPENFVKAITLDGEIAPVLFRKLKSIATLIDSAEEVEDFQSIGVQCREILIELGNAIYQPYMAGEEEQPQKSNFKKKAELFVKFYLTNKENSDYRGYIKKLTEATWDYASKITHSQKATYYEASTCVTLTTSLVSVYENIRQKVYDPISQYICKNCKSKKLTIVNDDSNENGIVKKLYLQCEECQETIEVVFEEKNDNKYIKGVVIE